MYAINEVRKHNEFISCITKIINIILYIITIPIIIFNFIIIIKTIINPNEVPDFFGYKDFMIVSGSMEPTIMTGDAIIVKEVPESELHENDIISFRDKNIITTHRIIKIEKQGNRTLYTTKGDNNNTEDREKISYEEIEGKYQFKLEGLGIIIKILQSKVTLLILVAILLINYWFMSKINGSKKV